MDALVEIRCPACRRFDWYRDGYAMYELADGAINSQRLTPSADLSAPWSCAACGYEVKERTNLSRALTLTEVTHPE